MSPVAPPSASALDQLRRLVYYSSAIVLDASKNYLFYARLAPIMSEAGLGSFEDLVSRVSVDKPLAQRVVEAMTTNETSFFRDVHPFEALRKVILPEFAKTRNNVKSLNIWSAAASTGQELYSIAFLVKDLAHLFPAWTVRLSGTDLSNEVLARAQEGRYSQVEVNRGLPAAMLSRYFTKVGTDWQVNEDIRKTAEFRRLNLIESWPRMRPLDVVFLRNVLIYFDAETRRKILEKVCGMMRPGGYLFLGGVETASELSNRLEVVQIDKTICYRAISEGVKNVGVKPT